MSNHRQEQSLTIAKDFIRFLEQKDISSLSDLLTENVVLRIPLTPTGNPEPWYKFDGKNATLGYLQGACVMFARLHWVNPEYTVSSDGSKVFVEAHGDLIKADGNVPYENVYVYRFDINQDKIAAIHEYANPVTFSKLMNLPVG